jgi:septal ring factor EnvC (AmiA/AmiB activator)
MAERAAKAWRRAITSYTTSAKAIRIAPLASQGWCPMYSISRCMAFNQWLFRARKYSSGHKACMLGVRNPADPRLLEMPRRPIVCCLFALMGLLSSGPSRAAAETTDSAQARAKLAEVRGRIAALTTRLGAELKDRDTQAARLREADLAITTLRRRLEGLHADEVSAERRRGELRAEAGTVKSSLDAERRALAAQVNAAYRMGGQEQLKLLLNQGDPAGVGRALAYYGYFARDRAARLAEIGRHVDRLEQLTVQIDLQSAEVRSLEADVSREMAGLQQARVTRTAALAAATTEVANGTEELKRLKGEEQAEETLLADLARVLQDFPVDTQQSFDSLRGRLPWPVQGRVTAKYQTARGGAAGVRRNGVLIETSRGAKVRAPYFGRVVYADWLQGLGLLLILGHNGNYMTLYGHAEVLYKSVGDWVAPGDVIAAVSDAAGASPQLYFEIRDGRTPQDPKIWLKPAP